MGTCFLRWIFIHVGATYLNENSSENSSFDGLCPYKGISSENDNSIVMSKRRMGHKSFPEPIWMSAFLGLVIKEFALLAQIYWLVHNLCHVFVGNCFSNRCDEVAAVMNLYIVIKSRDRVGLCFVLCWKPIPFDELLILLKRQSWDVDWLQITWRQFYERFTNLYFKPRKKVFFKYSRVLSNLIHSRLCSI